MSIALLNKKLTVIGVPRGGLQGPYLFLLEAGAVRVDLEAESLCGEVAVARVDEADGPPAALLVLCDDVAGAVHVAVAVTVQTVHRGCGQTDKHVSNR